MGHRTDYTAAAISTTHVEGSIMTAVNHKPNGWLLFSCTIISIGAIFWGYDIGILSTIYVSPGFKQVLNFPSSGDIGLITAIFYAGQFIGFAFLAGPVNNRLGRRWAGFCGVVVLCIGAALQTAAIHLSMMVIGRIIAGLGTGVCRHRFPCI